MNSKLMTTFALVVALAAVGAVAAVAAETVMVAQQAYAGFSHHGCSFHSNGFKNSHGRCFHFG
jgi:hypothetical protein